MMGENDSLFGITENGTHIIVPVADPLVRRMLYVYSCCTPDDGVRQFLTIILSQYNDKDKVAVTKKLPGSYDIELLYDGCVLIGSKN